jgi:hypothetical protein
MSEFRARGGGMDRDTLMDDLDLILERSRDDELPGEWDWEPPLGTGAVAMAAAEPRETEETDTEASSKGASDPVDGPRDETDDEAESDADDEDQEDD